MSTDERKLLQFLKLCFTTFMCIVLCFIAFTGLNPYLTLNTSASGTILIDLSTEDKEFQSVEEEVNAIIKSLSVFLLLLLKK